MNSGWAEPWVGLRPFGRADEPRFHGRTREIPELADLWRRHRLTLLVGHAGAGKTSLLHAGVVPYLESTGADFLPIGGPGHRHGLPAPLVPARSPEMFALLTSWRGGTQPVGSLGLMARDLPLLRRNDRGPAAPVLAAIDGADRIMRTPAPTHERFVRELEDALTHCPDVHLLLSVRSAAYPGVRRLVAAVGGPAAVAEYTLGPLSRASAIDALNKPLGPTQVKLQMGDPARIVDALRAVPPGVIPGEDDASPVEPVLLQVICSALGEWLRASGHTGVIPSRAVPDVSSAITDFCVRTLDRLTGDHGLPTCEIGTWLRRVFAAAPDAVAPLDGRPPEIDDRVVRAVEDRHLIKITTPDGGEGFQLLHPVLAAGLRMLGDARHGPVTLTHGEHLAAAAEALAAGNAELAKRQALAAIKAAADANDGRTLGEAYLRLGDIEYGHGDLAAAATAYTSAIETFNATGHGSYPGLGEVHAAVAQLRLMDGEHSAALEEIRVGAVHGTDPGVRDLMLVQARWYKGELDAAKGTLQEILSRAPTHAEALRIRGEMLVDEGRAGAALEVLGGLAVLQPSAAAARALAFESAPGAGAAPDDIEALAAEAPGNGLVLLRAAQIMRLRGDQERAVRYAAEALTAANPRLAKYHREEAERLARRR